MDTEHNLASTHASHSSPGVEVSLRSSSAPSSALFQCQFGEDANQNHDGHHAADDVDNEVCAVPILVVLTLGNGGHRLTGIGPDGRVIVGADALVQPLLAELAAEAVEAGPAAVQKDASLAVERWVPLAHHIVVTLATGPTNRRDVLIICVATAGGGGQPCLWSSIQVGLHKGGRCLVGQCGRGNDGVTLGNCHRGNRWVLAEGRLS